MTDVVVVPALARLVAVLAPVALGAELLTSGPRVPRPALAPSVHWVAGGVVVAVALVGAVWAECAARAGLTAVRAAPPARAATLSVHVIALGPVLAGATGEENRAIKIYITYVY